MKVKHISNNLIQLTKWGAFNCFLVREDDGFTLIDTAMPNCSQAILETAQRQGLEIKRVLLTHAHTDHVGSLDELSAQLPSAEFLFSARTEQFLRGDITLAAGEPDSKIRGGFVKRSTQATRHIEADEMIGSLKVIPAPGHAPDHLAYLDTRDGTLFGGDSFQTQGGIAVAGTLKLLFPFPAFATWHKPTALQTAKRLRSIEPSRLAVGHGPVLDKPLAVMDQAIRKVER